MVSNLYFSRQSGFLMMLGLSLCVLRCAASASDEEHAGGGRSRLYLDRALGEAAAVELAGGDVLNVAFLAVETVFNSELMAPYDVIHHTLFRDEAHYMLPFIVSPDGLPIKTFEGIELQPHFSFETVPEIDILVIPSTGNSM